MILLSAVLESLGDSKSLNVRVFFQVIIPSFFHRSTWCCYIILHILVYIIEGISNTCFRLWSIITTSLDINPTVSSKIEVFVLLWSWLTLPNLSSIFHCKRKSFRSRTLCLHRNWNYFYFFINWNYFQRPFERTWCLSSWLGAQLRTP